MLVAALLSVLPAAPVNGKGPFMDCGNTSLCGVLTLETGLGPGAYHHDFVSVHGLWPETGSYGSSRCIAPTSSDANPTEVYTCYEHPGGSGMGPLEFEKHEWDKHGRCAGVKDADDFFGQLCSLSKAPLQVMDSTRKAGHADLPEYQSALESAGYSVFGADREHMQLMLSACAGADGKWKLAAVGDFGAACPGGSGPPRPTPPTPTPPTPTPQQCEPNVHGPACQSDSQCVGHDGCVRCAKSGFCTNVPKKLVAVEDRVDV